MPILVICSILYSLIIVYVLVFTCFFLYSFLFMNKQCLPSLYAFYFVLVSRNDTTRIVNSEYSK